MSLLIAILGLALLILVHESGHFFASLAVGLRPRRFYVGFPPAVAKKTWKGIEYALGAIPLGGFVTIPGMHRPIPHDAERRFARWPPRLRADGSTSVETPILARRAMRCEPSPALDRGRLRTSPCVRSEIPMRSWRRI